MTPVTKRLWIAATVVFALVAAGSLVLGSIDWNNYRAELANTASQQLGLEVALDGRIDVSLLPRPAFRARGVRLTVPGGEGKPVASADNLNIRLGVMALLEGRIAVQRIELDGLSLSLYETPSGGWAIEGFDQNSETQSEGNNVGLDGLRLTNSQVSLTAASGAEKTLTGLSLRLKGDLENDPLEWQAAYRIADTEFETTGKIQKVRTGDGHTMRGELITPAGTVSLSGRGVAGESFRGRVEAEGHDIAGMVNNLGTHAFTPLAQINGEARSFKLDIQADYGGGLLQLVGRTFRIDETRGQIELMITPRNSNVTGTLALGVVDLSKWQSFSIADAKNDAGDENRSGLNGTVDISMEGIATDGGLIQQFAGSVLFDPEDIRLSQMQALFPGAAQVTLNGAYHRKAEAFDGTVGLVSGSMKDFFAFAGVPVSDTIPRGRLATAELTSSIAFDGNQWRMTNLDGAVDTTAVRADLTGSITPFQIAQVTAELGRINLDAYIPEGEGEGEDENPFAVTDLLPAHEVAFDVKSDRVLLRGQAYRSVAARGVAAPQGFSLDQLHVLNKVGTLEIKGFGNQDQGAWNLDISAQAEKWTLPFAKTLFPEIKPVLKALSARRFTGDIQLTGLADNLRLSANLDQGNATYVVGGTVGNVFSGTLYHALQGTVTHKNLNAFAHYLGIPANGRLPGTMTFVSNLENDADNRHTTVSGSLSGGQINLDINSPVEEGAISLQASFDHPNGGQVLELLGAEIDLPNPAEAIRTRANALLSDAAWSLTDMEIRNGDAYLKGALSQDEQNRLNGNLEVARIGYSSFAGSSSPAGLEKPLLLPELAGDIALNLIDIDLAGQTLNAPDASMMMGDGVMRLSLGNEARLNDGTISGQIDAVPTETGAVTVHASIDASRIDIAKSLTGWRVNPFMSGDAKLKLALEGTGQTRSEIVRSLKGEVDALGWAGAMHFIAVQDMLASVSAGNSPVDFLQSIGGFLRGGQTAFGELNSRIIVDGGVALVETMRASGDWGALELNGQIDLSAQHVNLRGAIDVTRPEDAPDIPLTIEGSFTGAQQRFASRAFEQFIVAQMERRTRAEIFRDQSRIEAAGGGETENPVETSVKTALGLLERLRAKQKAAREAEARRKAAEEAAAAAAQQP